MKRKEEETTTLPVSVCKIKTGIKAGKPLGDVVADITHATGLDKAADAYTRLTGKDCGCEERRSFLNRLSFWD